jgi:hypothetical protein
MHTAGSSGNRHHPLESSGTPEKKYPVEMVHERLCELLAKEGTSDNPKLPDAVSYGFEAGGTNWVLSNYLDDNNRRGQDMKRPFRGLVEQSQSFLVIEPAPDEERETKHYIMLRRSDVIPNSTLDTAIVGPALEKIPMLDDEELPDMVVLGTDMNFPHQPFRWVDKPSEEPVLIELANPGIIPLAS